MTEPIGKEPSVKIVNVRLLSAYYSATAKNLSPPTHVECSLEARFRKRGKKEFSVRLKDRVKAEGMTCLLRFEAIFSSEMELTATQLKDDNLTRSAVELVLPFASEVVAYVTGRSLNSPVIVPANLLAGKPEEK